MVHHSLSPRQYLILGVVAISAPLGDACLSQGMKNMPAITLAHPVSLIAAVFTPWIAVGIVLITLGVGFVAQGPSLTQQPAPEGSEMREPAESKVETR